MTDGLESVEESRKDKSKVKCLELWKVYEEEDYLTFIELGHMNALW